MKNTLINTIIANKKANGRQQAMCRCRRASV